MSMVDTWAATGAGAFSLSENGLYTVEGWRKFLGSLAPNGVFTVSRWYSPKDVDETGRLLSLAKATLLDMGVPDPRQPSCPRSVRQSVDPDRGPRTVLA